MEEETAEPAGRREADRSVLWVTTGVYLSVALIAPAEWTGRAFTRAALKSVETCR